MDKTTLLGPQVRTFLANYDAAAKDRIWREQSERFRTFWGQRVLAADAAPIPDDECDPIIRILDRNGKGNTFGCEAVARAMVAQGAWRRLFNELHSDLVLAGLVDAILTQPDPQRRAAAIDALYEHNKGKKNRLTGPSGNVIGAFLAAYDPSRNLSIISMGDRRDLIERLGLPFSLNWASATVGQKMSLSNDVILNAFEPIGLSGSARTISSFVYLPEVSALWKGEHTVSIDGQKVSVAVPTVEEEEEEDDEEEEEDVSAQADGSDVASCDVRESMQVQAKLALIGELMGFKVWLPRSDRARVLKAWTPRQPSTLVEMLPLGYDSATMATIEQIDVIWLSNRSIVRAFEVEHTTSVYSGLLRMADLVALQPNIDVKLHIVASIERRAKVLREIKRPVFSFIEGRKLQDTCTFLSYDSVREIAELEHLEDLNPRVIDKYVERASSHSDGA